MKENYFSKKMTSKSDEELEKMVSDKVSFVANARQAALWELESRKGKTEELSDASDQLDEELLKEESGYFSDDEVLDDFNPALPTLYSKLAIMIFCGLFSTLFGTVLYMMNLYRLKKKTEMFLALLFGILYTLFVIVILGIFPRIGNFSIVLNIAGGYILSEALWNTQIGKSTEINKRNFLVPFMISLILTISILILMFQNGLMG